MSIKNEIKELYNKLSKSAWFLIAGPCVIENQNNLEVIASKLKEIEKKYSIPIIFKASYKKANRSNINSYTGPGMKKGLKMLQLIKEKFSFPVITDIHEAHETKSVAEVADILQIPAFLCRQTDLLISAARTDRIVNIKKGQFVSPAEMKNAADKVASTENNLVMLTERGTSFGYNNLIVDFRSFMEMEKLNYPVVYDATHSLQRPAVHGNVSGGQPEYVCQMAKAAMATGSVSGLFIEAHPDPENAKSDAKAMLPLDQLENLVIGVNRIKGALDV